MNSLKSACRLLSLSLLALIGEARADDGFRTDINPALLYYQAFAVAPELSTDENQHLRLTEWRGRVLDPRFEGLITKYDNCFELLRRAAHARPPCDWGVDFTQGPEALLPALAKAKAAAQMARLRVMWHLQHGRQADARDDLLAAFTLGRNVSKDGLLISALVQIAIENILISVVAENFFQFSPKTLEQIVAGFDNSPARGTILQCVPVEKSLFYSWFLTKIRGFQAESPGADALVLDKARDLFAQTLAEGENPDSEFAARVIAAAEGTSAGLVNRLHELEAVYDEFSALQRLPFDQYESAARALDEKLAKHPNPLVRKFYPAVHSRGKEFAVMAKLAMVRAAVEYRLRGPSGFKKIANPCGHGPFELARFVFEGVDRGFTLNSNFHRVDFEEVVIFVEKNGPPFQVQGKNAGKALPK